MISEQIAQILSEPVQINKTTLKNRLVMGPMAAHAATKDGHPSEQTIAFFEARARGGIGMIIVGGIGATSRAMAEAAAAKMTGLRFDADHFIPDLTRLADAVHAYGVPIIAEILPSLGRMARMGPGGRIISASPKNVVVPEERFPQGFRIPGGLTTPVPDEASLDEIKRCEDEMIESVVRAQRAGWDGAEVAAHMSYFAASFLSPRTNWRTDEYGGSVENRARMLVNVVKGIRERVVPEFIVGLRITANDYVPDSQGVAAFAAIAKQVEAAGIDYVALAPGCYEAMDKAMPAVDGILIDTGDARVFKETMSVPVLLQGLHDPSRAAQAITDGHGDLVMLARQMLADPEYARKACEGRISEIVRCDRDNQCLRRLMFNMPIRCSVNPSMGIESRKPGTLPPISRFVQAPAERIILGLTGAKWFMDLVGMILKMRRQEKSS